MTLGERIKKLRKDLALTQQEFANRIGSTQNVLANYETGRRNPSSSVINNICKTFNVDETWLRTGEGEMFVQRTEEDELSQVFSAIAASELIKRILRTYWMLDDKEKAAVKKLIGSFLSEDLSVNPAAKQEASKVSATGTDLVAEIADLKRQNRELAERLKAIEKEDAEQEKVEAAAQNVGHSQFH